MKLVRSKTAAATINDARLFRLPEVGYVEPGWVADLIAVQGDPTERIGDFRPAVEHHRGPETHAG